MRNKKKSANNRVYSVHTTSMIRIYKSIKYKRRLRRKEYTPTICSFKISDNSMKYSKMQSMRVKNKLTHNLHCNIYIYIWTSYSKVNKTFYKTYVQIWIKNRLFILMFYL